ncbi:dTDP-4-dehydrorhamnose reductase [Burkholderia sp. MSMB617WGS]|uniref:dTDP-4-dehydrorhamnose reductase n=1 Tax=Burkholderia savannae TaxID=1637837 RepID=A0ABR5TEB0_9BURK|nr:MULTISPECIES: dTDP-4-dehydrorhamnose reductase [Burkholderia]AOJ80023.1 dTDP-4-dehydrorhamnose reductase [Burkholderia savannae]AOK46252.1 dTDP-4-dehydrorhamnose reductase [Burkholderia sp. MSMB617WGS]KGR95471.1 dTDP-4-dehydrorhamnose reductase [Burkholderia sp. ABCPW 111]KWZ42224.1 dTDP-4-dehydrorhamnose reductase [Burkholderia savannae]KWZ45293.1 dTDP-4-dehydrorhamnose reductase [Burkholderia savannae]
MSAQTSKRTILVTGVSGQVGFQLARTLQGLGRIVALDRAKLDLANLDQLRTVVRDVRPALIVNPAAYTAVDQAESEPELAMRINGEAPGALAEEAERLGAALIHYSTDYVFSGDKDGVYVEDDPIDPQNVYGRTKLAGEQAIAAVGGRYFTFRTSWVYGTRGKNFLLTMLRLGAERPELKVVSDQFGAPTWSNTIATLTAHVVAQAFAADDPEWWRQRSGVYHMTAGGGTSWHGFASAIFELSQLDRRPDVQPIPASAYPSPAKRPTNSRMSGDKLEAVFGLRAPDWREALRLCLEER